MQTFFRLQLKNVSFPWLLFSTACWHAHDVKKFAHTRWLWMCLTLDFVAFSTTFWLLSIRVSTLLLFISVSRLFLVFFDSFWDLFLSVLSLFRPFLKSYLAFSWFLFVFLTVFILNFFIPFWSFNSLRQLCECYLFRSVLDVCCCPEFRRF